MLVVLDGWGIAQPYSGNAVSQAETIFIKDLISRYPAMTLRASGEAVGLPWGEVGNSEVGHLNLGLGRIVYQDLPRINKSISDNSFFQNKFLLEALAHVKKNNSKLHLLGLTSSGCIHASIEHLQALLAFCQENKQDKAYLHCILDGRDTAYNSGLGFIKDIERIIDDCGVGKIATLCGRFYAMDRDNHWDRIEKAYNAMVLGQGNVYGNPIRAIEESYDKKIYDEEFSPTVITDENQQPVVIDNNDAVIFFNYRSDRAREITKALVLPGLEKFSRKKICQNLFFVSFTEYENNLPVTIAFPQEILRNSLGEVLASSGFKQLRISETEKYAHVTYFFNGGKEEKCQGEDHVLIPSPAVSSYDQKPEMSSADLTDKLLNEIERDYYDFILINYPNADMVGHTGNLQAAVKGIETLDKCINKIVRLVLAKDGVVLVTADHGNAESMFNMQTGMIDKEHTANPVPFILVGKKFEGLALNVSDAPGGDLSLVEPQGILSDVAPTILDLLGLEKPEEMTGRSLIKI